MLRVCHPSCCNSNRTGPLRKKQLVQSSDGSRFIKVAFEKENDSRDLHLSMLDTKGYSCTFVDR